MRKICVVFIVLGLISPFHVSRAAGVPFGGLVTFEYVCNTGFLVYVATAKGVIPFMWLWGNLPFASHIPPHPGQYLLGMASPTPVPCILGYIPIGAGLPIIYHGSSL